MRGAVVLPLTLVATSFALAPLAAPAAAPSTKPGALERQWAIAARPAVKIEVRRNGWYRVSRSRLAAAGFELSSPSRLRLSTDGNQVPIQISRGSLEFYGVARDTPSTDTRTYWLARGARGGLRIPVASKPAGRGLGYARSFPFTLERKYRTIYASLQNGERQNYFGEIVSPEPTTLVLRTRDAARRPASLEVTLQGLSEKAHQIELILNGVELGKIGFRGQAYVSRRVSVPRGVLREGANSLKLTAVGGELDFTLIDTVRLTYPRRYRADRNALRFSVPPRRAETETGFSRRNVTVV